MAKILVIDDEEQVRKYLRKILEVYDYEVLEASNGKIGLELYRKEPADLIILDIIMPEKEGIETIRELKRSYPDVKIIAISGGGDRMGPSNLLTIAKNLGANLTIEKPFENEEILNAVKSVVNT